MNEKYQMSVGAFAPFTIANRGDMDTDDAVSSRPGCALAMQGDICREIESDD